MRVSNNILPTPVAVCPWLTASFCSCSSALILVHGETTLDENQEKKLARAVFTVRELDCATCAFGIEKQVKKVRGVKDVRAAVMLNQVFIDYDESKANISEIMQAIDRAPCSNRLIRREAK